MGYISEHIRHLKRGRCYNIQGKNILTIGGADSVDKFRRTEGLSWWKEEAITDEGVYVGEVLEDSAAQKAGIKANDIIVKIGDTKLTSMSDLTKALYTYKTGDKTTLVVNRDNREVTLNVKF